VKPCVTVVDYGVGNLFSVIRALEHCGADVSVADSASSIERADRLLLPGVGAYSRGIQEIRNRGLELPLKAFAASGRPFLGICLGMQLMLDESEEFGNFSGLGLIAGTVKAIPLRTSTGTSHKVPHIGWSELNPISIDWSESLLKGLSPGSAAYFVHSFTAFPTDESIRIADSDYDGCRISAVIQYGNLFGCQFHPERSGETGLHILRNYLATSPIG